MARSRNIKPGFFTNPELVELSFETRLLFAGLWTVADRKGRLQDRPKKIKMEVFPADAVDIDMMLAQLHKAGFICRYEVEGEKYIVINSWAKHQAPHHTERKSVIPPAPHEVEEDETQCVNGYETVDSRNHLRGNPPDSLIHRFTDSPIPDSPIPDSSDIPSVEPAAAKPTAHTRGSRLDPEWVLPKTWGDWALAEFPSWTPDVVRAEAAKFKDHWLSESGAKARKSDWLATWRKWCRSDICQRANSPPPQQSETSYQRSMRERVEQAAGSMAHIVAAKPPGYVKTPEPWEIAAHEQNRALTHAVGGPDLLEADDAIRTGFPVAL